LPLADILNPQPLVEEITSSGRFAPLVLGSFYTFPVAVGSLISVSVTVDEGRNATLILLNSRLEEVASADNGVLLAIPAPASDDYMVMVIPQTGIALNEEAGFITALNIDVAGSRPATATSDDTVIPITYGNTATSTITDFSTERRFIFFGTEGDVVEIDMTATGAPTVDTLLRLIGPDGEVVAENDDIEPGVNRNSRLKLTLATTGDYVIVATRFEDASEPPSTGDFRLTIFKQDPILVGVDPIAKDIRYGEPITDSITEDIFLRFYYFMGQGGDQLEIEVNTIEGNLDSILYLYTFTSDNLPFFLAANDDSELGNTFDPYLEVTLPRSGPYLVAVARFNNPEAESTVGTYTITIRRAIVTTVPTEASTEGN
jgi:hypothetical protein